MWRIETRLPHGKKSTLIPAGSSGTLNGSLQNTLPPESVPGDRYNFFSMQLIPRSHTMCQAFPWGWHLYEGRLRLNLLAQVLTANTTWDWNRNPSCSTHWALTLNLCATIQRVQGLHFFFFLAGNSKQDEPMGATRKDKKETQGMTQQCHRDGQDWGPLSSLLSQAQAKQGPRSRGVLTVLGVHLVLRVLLGEFQQWGPGSLSGGESGVAEHYGVLAPCRGEGENGHISPQWSCCCFQPCPYGGLALNKAPSSVVGNTGKGNGEQVFSLMWGQGIAVYESWESGQGIDAHKHLYVSWKLSGTDQSELITITTASLCFGTALQYLCSGLHHLLAVQLLFSEPQNPHLLNKGK